MMDVYSFLVTKAFLCLLDHQSTPSKAIFFRKNKTKNVLSKLKCGDAFNHATFTVEILPSLERIAKLSVIILTPCYMLSFPCTMECGNIIHTHITAPLSHFS